MGLPSPSYENPRFEFWLSELKEFDAPLKLVGLPAPVITPPSYVKLLVYPLARVDASCVSWFLASYW